MNKLFIKYTMLGLILVSMFGCSDKLEDYYPNPNGTTEADVAKLFSSMLYNDYVRPTYWAYRTFNITTPAFYTQMYGYATSNKMYQPNVSYTEDRWEGFYAGGVLSNYRAMEQFYSLMSEEEQAKYEVFMKIGKVVVYDQAAQLIDDWGDIPFSEAGSLNESNQLVYAKFDDAATLYTSFIEDLDAINSYLASVELSASSVTALTAQDYLNNGDVSAWRRYANSLRLRMLMKISNFNESLAQTEITAMLADPVTYPLVESNEDNILLEMNPEASSLISEITNAFLELGPYAGSYLLDDVMVANGDPRATVFWDPGTSGYTGIPSGSSQSEVATLTSSPISVATFDSLTFLYNKNLPGVMFTAAEVDFLKAEAYERWGGDAATAYADGVNASIEFYYSLNQNAVLISGAPVTAERATSPSADDIATYLAQEDIAYTGTTEEKLAKIGTQKWLNFFVLQANEAWSEVRRTGYPEIDFPLDPFDDALPPSRLLYPNTEKTNNAANYAAVSGADDRFMSVFWDVD